MRPRYLAAISKDGQVRARVARALSRFAPLQPVFERGPLLLFANRAGQALGDRGMLLGDYFEGGSGPVVLDDSRQRAVLRSGGESLIESGWGGYVAIVVSERPDEVRMVRAPLGDLPCYWWRSDALTLVASDLASMQAAGMERPSIDACALARHMAAEDLRRRETCLFDIGELQGGERLEVAGAGLQTQILWSPWRFAADEAQFADVDQAMDSVRHAALDSAACLAGRFRSILLKLSGGLDSSILAACLARSQAEVTCLNLVTGHPAGDERDYARAVAAHLKLPLAEHLRRTDDVALERSAAARLPRPTARAFTQASTARALALAAETGAEAVFDGGGGDNVFCSLQSARPAADCLRRRAGRPFFWPTAASIASLAEVSLWAVARRALAISCRQSAPYRWSIDTRFLSPGAAREASKGIPHPWLEAPAGALPGKAAHVALVAAAQSVIEGADAEDDLPDYSPLISQRLVETCLRIPSWMWFGAGQNRFLARRAFAADLPRAVVERRSKGAPDCFVADLYEANKAKIRAMLLGGVLDRARLIDRPSVERALENDAPVEGHDFLRIMHLADAEAWARSWS